MSSFDSGMVKQALLFALDRDYKFYGKHGAKGLLRLDRVIGTARWKLMNDGIRPLPTDSTFKRCFMELVREGKAEDKVIKVRRVHRVHFVKPAGDDS